MSYRYDLRLAFRKSSNGDLLGDINEMRPYLNPITTGDRIKVGWESSQFTSEPVEVIHSESFSEVHANVKVLPKNEFYVKNMISTNSLLSHR